MDFNYSWKYIAGLIDSDGNIFLSYNKSTSGKMYPVVRVTIAQTFPFILFSLKNNLKFGQVIYSKCQKSWYYQFISHDARKLLNQIYPYLIIKKKQAGYCLGILFNEVSSPYNRKTIIDKKRRNSNYRFEFDESLKFNYNWFAGYFDGDGCILASKSKNCAKPRIRFMITIDRREISFANWLKKNVGGNIYKQGRNIRWSFELNTKAIEIGKNLLPYLNIKKIQLKKCMNWLKKYPTNIKKIVDITKTTKFIKEMSALKLEDNVLLTGTIDAYDYQKWTRTTAIYPQKIGLYYVTMGLVGEAGEIANIVKKVIRDKKGKLDLEIRKKLKKEISDFLWYSARLCDELGLNLTKVLEYNMVKLESRKQRNKIKGSGDER